MDKKIDNLPLHVAITMDGNGRWATLKKLPRTAGHKEGLNTVKQIVKTASDIGIKFLTLYVFSTENWKRAEEEVGFLMNLIHIHLKGELNFYKNNQIKINHIGSFSNLSESIQKDISDCIEATKNFTGLTLNLAINYGGRDEIIRGIKKIIEKGIPSSEISENNFSQFLDMPESPDVDLLIRTGGEKRLSNYLLWHVPYAEQIYIDTLWPDYTSNEFIENIYEFSKRNRRFGAEKSKK